MLIRYITAGACGLCLVVPALAAARPIEPPVGHPGSAVHGVVGDTNNDGHVTAYERQIAADTHGRAPRAIAPAASAPAAAAPVERSVGGWRIAAFLEATLLAGCAAAAALALAHRRRGPQLGV